MSAKTSRIFSSALCLGSVFGFSMPALCVAAASVQQGLPAASGNRRIGAVTEINGTVIRLTADDGTKVSITVPEAARVVRIAPGEKDLKNAAPIHLQDVQVGDRILVGGKPGADNQTFEASSIVVMKRSDLQARNEQNLQDWQKRGVDGLAKSVDAAAGTVTITVRGKDVFIHASNKTVIRRYAPDSVKFDDATPSTLREIHPGDQVRARGDRSADGSELTAEEVVSGAFPLFAGTINSVDASASTISVHDLSSKKTVVVRVTQDSQLRHLPPEMAQRIAMRLKGAATGRVGGAAAPGSVSANGKTKSEPGTDPTSAGAATEGGMARRGNGMGRPGGAPDLQLILNHAPPVSLADLHKGDAVVILLTEGKEGSGTAIKLFSGVEPILQAAPNAAQAMMVAPWSLGGPSGDLAAP